MICDDALWPTAPVSRLALSLGLVLGFGCGSSRGSDDGDGDGSTGAEDDSTGAAVDPPADPYGVCGDPAGPVACDDHPAAICEQRDDADGEYAVCAVACTEDADCPLLAAGNIPPACVADSTGALRCRIPCAAGAPNSCPTDMSCIDGDPAQCMWTTSAAATHATVAEFCVTACTECGGALFLPWTDDCAAECEADLADCDAQQQQTAFACTGGPGCPAGGVGIGDCLNAVECIGPG